MALSKDDLVNIAFDILGKTPVADIDNARGDELVRRARARYQQSFDFAMIMADWPAMRKVKEIPTAAGDKPEGEFLNRVQLPADCLKVWRVNNDIAGWKRVAGQGGGFLLTNAAVPLTLIYGRRLDPAEMPAWLARLCAAQLAEDIKAHAGLSRSEREEVAGVLKAAVRDANFMSGADDGTDSALESPWLSAMNGA